MDKFKEIRPYNDDEVQEVLQRLGQDPELISAIARFKFPRLAHSLPMLIRPLVRWGLQRQLQQVRSIKQVQDIVADYMARMIRTTTTELSYSGLDRLDPNTPYLFVANHRDIAMDPAFVNYGLYHNGFDTVRIAIGDNLLQKPYASDLMRLNKSFIVKRSAKGVREMMQAFTLLSAYINHSILEDHCNIWIAQREGRAKDGIDRTDPAIIKMFYMSRKKKGGPSFSEVINELNIVPVSIAYEYDPCDQAKARELYAKEHEGAYEKMEFEDIESIVKGITGFKGRVHVAFGEPLRGELPDAEAAAAAIDRQILTHYHLYPSNYLALEQLQRQPVSLTMPAIDATERARFEQRLQACPEHLRPYWLAMYANPILNREGLLSERAA